MQPIIDAAHNLRTVPVGFILGVALIGILLAQSLIVLYSMFKGLVFEREQRQSARREMDLSIQAALSRCNEAEQNRLVWNGYRKFRVARKVPECHDVFSFYLEPHDSKPVPLFKPGQYLTFQLQVPGKDKPIIRCYSLSDSPHPNKLYRVTIKRAVPPSDPPSLPVGLASSYFCDKLREGDILNVKAPGGNFFLDLNKTNPVVLISGGVGITPMLSMLNAIIESRSQREVWFFFGGRNRKEHIKKDYLEKIAREHSNVHLHICYSNPGPDDVAGKDFQHAERVSVELFKRLLPSNNFEYYICGPPAMMKGVTDGLREWGVPDESVFFEAFGPATVKRAAAPVTAQEAAAPAVKVTFSRSGKISVWNTAMNSLLDLAEEAGIKIDSGCRAGNCGTCLVAIRSGSVEYLAGHGAPGEEGSCLTCICKPKTDIILDA